jgi:hypothetical protein
MTTRTDAQLGIDIDVQTSKAGKKVKKFSKGGQKAFKSMEKASKQFSLAFKGAIALFAGQKVLGAFNSVTQAAIKQENAINALNTQLKLSGDFSEQTSKDMQDFASSLQAVSTQGDETTLELLALSKTFDTTDVGAKKLTLAATELAAATGKAPQEALKQLAKSYSGLAGELGESLPATREFTQEQLKAGAAVDLVLERFGGSATGKLDTFDGALTQLTNSFGDLLEEIGFSVTQSPELIESFGGLKNAVEVLSNFIKDADINFGAILADGIGFAIKSANVAFKIIVTGLSIVAKLALEVAKGFNLIARAVLDIGKSEKGLKILRTGFEFLSDSVGVLIAGLSGIAEFLGFDTTALDDAAQSMAELAVQTSNLSTEDIDQLQTSLDNNIESIDTMQDDVTKLNESFVKLGNDTVDAFGKSSKAINQTSKDLAKGLDGPQTKAQSAEAGKGFFEAGSEKFAESFEKTGNSLIDGLRSASAKGGKEAGINFGIEASKQIGEDAVGAWFGEGAGQAFGVLANLSLLSDEEITTFIDGIVEGGIRLIEALADKADVIIEALIDSLITNGGIFRIAKALVTSLVSLAGGFVAFLVNGLTQGIDAFFGTFLNNFAIGAKEFLGEFLDGILSLPSLLFTAFQDGATAIFDAISDALSVDLGFGGGGGFGLGGDKGLLGGSIVPGFLNQGGVVGVSGYTNGGSIQKVIGSGIGDTVPIMAEPGEVMIKKQAVPDFDSYVGEIAKQVAGNGGGDQVIQLEVSLGDEILESRMLRINQNNGRVA